MRRQPRDDGRKAREETKQITVVAVAAAVVVVAGTSLSLSRPPFPAFNAFDKHRNSIMQFFCFDDENLPRVFSRLCSLSLAHRILSSDMLASERDASECCACDVARRPREHVTRLSLSPQRLD